MIPIGILTASCTNSAPPVVWLFAVSGVIPVSLQIVYCGLASLVGGLVLPV